MTPLRTQSRARCPFRLVIAYTCGVFAYAPTTPAYVSPTPIGRKPLARHRLQAALLSTQACPVCSRFRPQTRVSLSSRDTCARDASIVTAPTPGSAFARAAIIGSIVEERKSRARTNRRITMERRPNVTSRLRVCVCVQPFHFRLTTQPFLLRVSLGCGRAHAHRSCLNRRLAEEMCSACVPARVSRLSAVRELTVNF